MVAWHDGRLVPVPVPSPTAPYPATAPYPDLPATKVMPVEGWPRMTYVRPLASAGIRVAFDRYDGE